MNISIEELSAWEYIKLLLVTILKIFAICIVTWVVTKYYTISVINIIIQAFINYENESILKLGVGLAVLATFLYLAFFVVKTLWVNFRAIEYIIRNDMYKYKDMNTNKLFYAPYEFLLYNYNITIK